MIVNRKALNFWERLYLPTLINGFKVTLRHFFKKKVTMQYPEEKWVVPDGYRGAPYLVKNQEGRTKCVSCQTFRRSLLAAIAAVGRVWWSGPSTKAARPPASAIAS